MPEATAIIIPGFAGIGASWPPKSTQTGGVDGTPQPSASAAASARAERGERSERHEQEALQAEIRVARGQAARATCARVTLGGRAAAERAGARARSRRGAARARGARPARRRPRGPRAARGPTSTARAPSASALTTSVPRRMPPSTSTSIRPSTASTTSGSDVDRRRDAVELPAAVVRDDDRRRAVLAREPRVLGGEHPLDDDRQPGQRGEPLDVAPGQRRATSARTPSPGSGRAPAQRVDARARAGSRSPCASRARGGRAPACRP